MTYYGYAGKILRLDMTNRKATVIDTEPYRRWGGGHGMGSALFWDFCKDKTITDGRNPANVCIIATSPLNGTPVPSGGGRCEVLGVGVGMYPVSWFTRSGFGGRFSTMLKQAGYDAIVIEGRASSPVWVDIRNNKVAIRDAGELWGKDTWETQLALRKTMGAPNGVEDGWWDLNESAEEALDLTLESDMTVAFIVDKLAHAPADLFGVRALRRSRRSRSNMPSSIS